MENNEGSNDEGPPLKRTRRLGPTSRGTTSYTRTRAVTACQVCRSRRTKCDNKKPKCSFCERTGAECVTAPNEMSTFDPASLRILERLDELQTQLTHSIETNNRPALRNLVEDSARLFQQRHHLFTGNLQAILEWDVIKGYWEAIPDHSTASRPVSETIMHTTSTLHIELDPSACDHLLDNFFSFDHIKNPILSEHSTRRLVKRVFSEGIGWDEESCLVLIICANGAIARSFFAESMSAAEIKQSQGPALYQAAQKRLGIVMASHGLIAAQCLFLFGVYKMCMLQPHDAWRMFLQALAACQQFDFLTTEPEPSSPPASAHAEECIYWSCWKSERELRWVLTLPDFGELANDHPKSFPSLPETLDEGEQLTGWYFYLSEISLWRLSTRARREMETFYSKSDNHRLESLVGLSHELEDKGTEWSQSLAPAVNLDFFDGHDESEVLRFILRGHVTSYHEAIWWPFVHAVINQDNTSPSVASCAAKGLAIHLQCLNINRSGFRYRHHGTWLLLQSCLRSALVLLAASKSENAAKLLPAAWEAPVQETIDMLRYWQNENVGASDSIIALLENLSI